MWNLLNISTKYACNLRYLNYRAPKFKFTNYLKSSYGRNAQTPVKNTQRILNKPISVFLAFSGAGIVHVSLYGHKVLCSAKKSRISTYKSKTELQRFDWRLFWQYVKPHIWYFVAAVIGALVVALINIQIPQVMGNVINVISKFTEFKGAGDFLRDVKAPALKLICMYVAQSVSTFFYIYMLSNLGEKLAYSLKCDLFTAILKQDMAFFDEQRTGEIINRVTSDIQDFKSSFKQTVSGGLRALAQILGSSVTLVMISPHMTFITLLCLPSVVAVGTLFGAALRSLSREAQSQIEKCTAVADEAVSNIRTVRAFGMEDQEEDLFKREAELAMTLNENLGFGIGWFQAGTNMFLNGMVLITVYMGGYLLSADKLSPGQLMAYLMASQTIQRSLGQLSLLFGSFVRGLAAGSRVFEYINFESSMRLKGGDIIPDHELQGIIEFKDVTFAYPTRKQQIVLKNFNLKVSSGQTLAIVGASGNGKSTVVALIERTSVLENIRYGQPDSSDEEVFQAAKLANAHDFITDFPDGYETLVGERGVTLSGGQKQRIAIARALLKDPSVLLLDEATSALDSESEKIVQHALDKARKGRTVIVIAHRLSTIQNADVIVVLNKGAIVEMGTHQELVRKRGYYWSLNFQQQEIPAA